LQIPEYCREIETYLCQKNDGHLIRVVGPSFDLVSRWAADGVPLKVAFRGIDRYFERYYRKGPRRRPVRIDFCEADVLDAFDEWRRALGLTAESPTEGPDSPQGATSERRGPSLPAHLERAVIRLTSARATGALGEAADDLVDRVSRELDTARASARGLRGDARRSLIERLAALDAELLTLARSALTESDLRALSKEAEEELAGFRATMTEEAHRRARDGVIDRLVRDRFGLPTLSFM
jgi:hypothetical protein